MPKNRRIASRALLGCTLAAAGCGGSPEVAVGQDVSPSPVPRSQEGAQTTDIEPTDRPAMEATTRQGGLPHYRFDQPELSWELPNKLMEVSGIACTGPSTLACVQDERGSLYSFDLARDGQAARKKFGPKGDYEGLARAGERLIVLRSDGAVCPLDLDGSPRAEFTNPLENVAYSEFESVAFEPAKERWLLMPKDAVSDGERTKDDRVIFALGLDDLSLANEPILVLSRKGVIESAEAHGWPLPMRMTKKGNEKVDFDFHPSDLVVDPRSGLYFILSGKDRTLIVVAPTGELRGTAVFPGSVLAQPEGLAFLPNGDLLIASEGRRGKEGRDGEPADLPAVVLRFPYLPD